MRNEIRNFNSHKLPSWVHPLLSSYYDTAIIPYQGKLAKKHLVQKRDVINELMQEYRPKTPVDERGLSLLYDRAEARGYMPTMIYVGLKTMICKNYVRSKYIPPNNDPQLEVIHERVYMEDWEFRSLFISSRR